MDVEDDAKDGFISYAILGSLESTQKGNKLSPEDVDWVESCLISDPDALESNWTSFKNVLLDIIADQPESLDSSATGTEGTQIKTPLFKESEIANYTGLTDYQVVDNPSNGDNKTNNNDIPTKLGPGIMSQLFQEESTETFRGNPFLPTYNEDLRKIEDIDLEFEFLSAEEMNLSNTDIFKVWDLEIPIEEGDLIFNEAAGGALDDEPLHNLVAGFANLSLNKSSS